MDASKRDALIAAGYRFGDAADFLELTAEERRQLDARVAAELSKRDRAASPVAQRKQRTRRKKT